MQWVMRSCAVSDFGVGNTAEGPDYLGSSKDRNKVLKYTAGGLVEETRNKTSAVNCRRRIDDEPYRYYLHDRRANTLGNIICRWKKSSDANCWLIDWLWKMRGERWEVRSASSKWWRLRKKWKRTIPDGVRNISPWLLICNILITTCGNLSS